MGDDVIRGEVLEVTRGEVVEVLSAADVLPAAILIDSDPIGTTAAMICMADVQDMDISPPDEYCYSSYTPKKWSEILTVIKVNFRSTELQKKWPISTALLTTDLDLSRVSPKQWSKTGRFLKPVYTKIREELRLREEAEKEGGGEVGPGGWKWRFGSRRRVQREIVKQWSEDLKQSRESLQDASETGDDSTDPKSKNHKRGFFHRFRRGKSRDTGDEDRAPDDLEVKAPSEGRVIWGITADYMMD